MHQRCLQCLQVFFLLLFLIHKACQRHLWDVKPHVSSLVFLFAGPFVEVSLSFHFMNGPKYLTRETAQVWGDSSCMFVFEYFSRFHLHLFDGVRFQNSQVMVSFLFTERSDLLLFHSFESFYISVRWWFLPGDWVTASLRILSDLNNAVVWMVPTLPLISKFSNCCTNSLVVVPRAPITTGIAVTFMFHSFFQFPSKVLVLIFLFAFFQFYSVICRFIFLQDRNFHRKYRNVYWSHK